MYKKPLIKFLDLKKINLEYKSLFVNDFVENLDDGWFIGGS